MRKKSKNKINYWLLFLIILLAVILVLSRARRSSRRAIYRPPATELQTKDYKDKAITDTIMDDLPDVSKDYLLGKIMPAQSDLMVSVKSELASREGMYMHKDAYEAFIDMHEAAMKDGINLVVISALRTFDHQKRIWENKWNGRQKLFGDIYATDIDCDVERAKEILRFSAMPGTSRHHWGADIDLNSLQNSYFESGYGEQVYKWLKKNAGAFGFCQPYTPHGQSRGGGYEEEKWHWSYMPVAKHYLEAYKNIVSYDDIAGFDGYITASKLNVIKSYVMDIDPACKK